MKKIFLSLLLGFVGLISFGYCENVSNLINIVQDGTFVVHNGVNLLRNISPSDYGVYCISVNTYSPGGASYVSFGFGPNMNYPEQGAYLNIYSLTLYNEENPNVIVCMKVNQPNLLLLNSYNYDITIGYKLYRLDVLLDTPLPQMTSLDCQNEYNLIPISSVDTNYCVENDLCPVPSNFSQLFINDIEFPSKPLINVSIPDYIQWDYSSNETGFDLYVGSGYDQDYIDSVLKINSYRPDSSDFTNIFVSGLTLLFPYLIFALFLVFMRKLIKRIFKH